jgi:hypothetical protein
LEPGSAFAVTPLASAADFQKEVQAGKPIVADFSPTADRNAYCPSLS